MRNPELTSSAAVLLVRDIVAAAHHYRDRLGFTFDRFWGEPPNFVILSRDACRLMLHLAPPGHAIVPHWRISPQMWNVYFWVDDADSLYAEYLRRGAKIDYQIHDKPYGIREFGIQDLDGYDIAFGSPIRAG
jgi:catechol 2,3-dioxygenase-like lactoylglutathione lyase family enzyme